MGRTPKRSLIALSLLVASACQRLPIAGAGAGPRFCPPAPRQVILILGDGMGFEQVRAGSYYQSGAAGALSFEILPHRAQMGCAAADHTVTDSAASATAMATGQKVSKRVVSRRLPGDGADLPTLVELFQGAGRSTGLVTTAPLVDASPAAFAAHALSRYDYAGIAADYLVRSRPAVLLGGGHEALPADAARGAGYEVAQSRRALLALDFKKTGRLLGRFGDGFFPYIKDAGPQTPTLAEMTRAALAVLERNPEGFFLFVENELIDNAGHENDIARLAPEVVELAGAVEVALAWIADRKGALLIVTADHETGGLTTHGPTGAGGIPAAHWSTGGHTSKEVPVYAMGQNAELVRGRIENTDLFAIAGGCALAGGEAR